MTLEFDETHMRYANSIVRTQVEQLRATFEFGDEEEQYAVCRSSNAPVDVLVQGASSASGLVRSAVAQNPKTPGYILDEMTLAEAERAREHPQEWEEKIFSAIANNPTTYGITLSRLFQVGSGDVMLQLLENANTPRPLLEDIAGEYEFEDEETAAIVNALVARHPNSSVERLTKFAEESDGNIELQCALAENPSIPIKILHHLATSKDVEVKIAAAGNLNAPEWLLRPLVETGKPELLDAVLENTGIDFRFREEIRQLRAT